MKNKSIGFIFSLLLHLGLIIFYTLGGFLFTAKPLPEELIIINTINIASINNAKPEERKLKAPVKEPEDAKEVKQATEAKPVEEKKEIKTPPKEEIKETPKEEKKKELPKEPKKSDNQEKLKKPEKTDKVEKDKKKEEPKPEKKEKKEIKSDTDLDQLMKNLEEASEGKNKPKNNKQSSGEDKKKNMSEFDEGKPMSRTLIQAIKQQIEENWNVPHGISRGENLSAVIQISLKTDGSIQSLKLLEKKCVNLSGDACQAFVNSAFKAIEKAEPFENLPVSLYEEWKEFNFEFDPTSLLN